MRPSSTGDSPLSIRQTPTGQGVCTTTAYLHYCEPTITPQLLSGPKPMRRLNKPTGSTGIVVDRVLIPREGRRSQIQSFRIFCPFV